MYTKPYRIISFVKSHQIDEALVSVEASQSKPSPQENIVEICHIRLDRNVSAVNTRTRLSRHAERTALPHRRNINLETPKGIQKRRN